MAPTPASWAVTEVRLVLGPAPTVGDLLAALVEVMTVTGVEAHDVRFDEVPEGRRLRAACRLRTGGPGGPGGPGGTDVAAVLAALLDHQVPAPT